jgi:hypothetical protein
VSADYLQTAYGLATFGPFIDYQDDASGTYGPFSGPFLPQPFVYGQPIQVHLELRAYADDWSQLPASASASFNGIDIFSIAGPGSPEYTAYTAASDTIFTLVDAPEPPTWITIAAGSLTLSVSLAARLRSRH